MSPSAGPVPTYVARFPGPFGALVQASTLGGMRMEALPASRVRDAFWDTPSADVLAAGWVLRVRHREAPGGDGAGDRVASLRSLVGDRPPLPLPGDPADGLGEALATALADALGRRPDRLALLFELRQFRTPRVVYDADRPVAVLSLDVVVAETGRPAGRVTHEARLRLTSHGGPADLIRLDPALREHGLVPATRSTIERAIQRIVPLRLLPDEREAVDRRARSDDRDLAIRASAVARVARGEAPAAVAAALGATTDEVEVWAEAVADHRLAALAPLIPSRPREVGAAKTYHVSALVGDGEPPARKSGEGDGLAALLDDLVAPPPATPMLDEEIAADASPAEDASSAVRRPGPALSLDAPLTAAAGDALALALAHARSAAAALTATPTARTALALRAAAADLRLTLAAFSSPDGAAVLPPAPGDRLSAALAVVEDRLLYALDADRASWLRTHREHPLLAARDAALSDVLAHLRGTAWPAALALGERLVGRLRAQAADGIARPDDGPVAETAPSALRHVIAGVLWRRVEAVRALDGLVSDVPGDVSTADALALALGGVRHALRLVAWPDRTAARDAADRYAGLIASVVAARDAAVAHTLAASVRGGEALTAAVGAAWEAALAPEACAAVAALVASAVEVR